MKKLRTKLIEFVKSNLDTDVVKATIEELRAIFKPKEELETVQSLKYSIFNSLWNRFPNFLIILVLKDKLRYAFKIGCGIASYNQLPISWIVDSAFRCMNFLMKDRGHITTLVCYKYGEKFNLKVVLSVVESLLTKWKSVDNWKDDYTLRKGVPILTDIYDYLNLQLNKYMEKNDGKSAGATISLKNICDNVTLFDKGLNKTIISIEMRKESIWAHAREILGLNNTFNKWIEYQKAFLAACTKFMKSDGDDGYFRSILQLDSLRNHIDTLATFMGEHTLFSNAVLNYKKTVKDYQEIPALKLLGVRCKEKSYENRGELYYSSREKDIFPLLESLHESGYGYEDAKKTLTLADKIARCDKWDEFETLRINLLEKQPASTQTKSLEDSRIASEDFAMACVDSVMVLLGCVPGMAERDPMELVDVVVINFVDELKDRLNAIVDDESYFGIPKHFGARFRKLILPAFRKAKATIESEQSETKPALFEAEIAKIKHLLNGQSKFKIIKPQIATYKVPETVEIDFAKSRKEGGLDLGQRLQGQGYTSGNVIAQLMGHNRQNDGNHDVSTVGYWEWVAEFNYRNVMNNTEQLTKVKDYKTLGDADVLLEIFTTKETQEKLKLEFEETVMA